LVEAEKFNRARDSADFVHAARCKKIGACFGDWAGCKYSVAKGVGQSFNPAGDVDRPTQYREVQSARTANVAMADLPGIDANADVERRLVRLHTVPVQRGKIGECLLRGECSLTILVRPF
jgi:hypothetical protein